MSRRWIKVDVQITRNPKIARLTDGQFRAEITSLTQAKLCDVEGEWPSVEHWRAAVGPELAAHLDALVAGDLLELDPAGPIRVHDWADHQQNDPTAAERAARYRRNKAASRVTDRDAQPTAGTGVTRDDRDARTAPDPPSRVTDRDVTQRRVEESLPREGVGPHAREHAPTPERATPAAGSSTDVTRDALKEDGTQPPTDPVLARNVASALEIFGREAFTHETLAAADALLEDGTLPLHAVDDFDQGWIAPEARR